MKGFYITIKNGLLEPKHYKKMHGDKCGVVWLFLWLLDKLTVIDDEIGEGKVLGGKPIKYEDVEIDLGISRATYKRWVILLREEGYIKTLRTPYGLSIIVYKAFKVFGQKTDGSPKSHPEEENDNEKKGNIPSPEPSIIPSPEPSNIRQYSRQYSIDNTNVLSSVSSETPGKAFNDLLYLFRNVNPNYEKLFANKTERHALQEMVEKYTFVKMKNLLTQLPDLVKKPYAPRITTPLLLQKRMGELILFIKQEQGKEVLHGNKNGIDATHL